MIEENATHCFVECLKEWQTLIAGVMALIAAIVTIILLRRQIRQSDKHADEVRRRKSRAARATMPAALSSLIEYVKGCALYAAEQGRTAEMRRSGSPQPDPNGAPALPAYPDDVVQVLRDCVEHAEAGPAEAVAVLLSELQVLTARLRDFKSDIEGRSLPGTLRVGTAEDAQRHVKKAANIYAMTEKLFSYARRQSESAPGAVEETDSARALRLMGFDEGSFPELFQWRCPAVA